MRSFPRVSLIQVILPSSSKYAKKCANNDGHQDGPSLAHRESVLLIDKWNGTEE